MRSKVKFNKNYVMVNIIKNNVNISAGEDKFISKDLYTFIGLDMMGNRDVLGLYLNKEEDNRFFLDIFEEFKTKGVERIYFVVSLKEDRLCKAIKISFPGTEIIPSLTMSVGKVWKFLTDKNKTKLLVRIKELYTRESYEECKCSIDLIKEEFKDNHLVLLLLEKYLNDIEKYYKFDVEVRKFLFNHTPFTSLYGIIKNRSNGKIYENLDNILKEFDDTLSNIEKNNMYARKIWIDIMNHCSKYFDDILEKVMVEI